MTEYRVELYRDNEGREPNTWCLAEYEDGKPAGSALGAITTDHDFAVEMAKFINGIQADLEHPVRETAPQMLEALKDVDGRISALLSGNYTGTWDKAAIAIREDVRAVVTAATGAQS
jgi:hypothetical protein